MPETPYLSFDLGRVRQNYRALRAALPKAQIRYAVKANPSGPVLRLLAGQGCEFDVASVGEIETCAVADIDGARLTFGNTIKKASDIARAHARGVRRFAFDTEQGLAAIAEHAPGAAVECRIAADFPASVTPFGQKFGCAPQTAAQLLTRAARLGLRAEGICFHVGSQQLDPAAWSLGIESAATIFDAVGELTMLNIGGGFPVPYALGAPDLDTIAAEITSALARHFGSRPPQLAVEPGRLLVAAAGTIACQVVGVRTGTDSRRWVYLDIGRYGGLAETENEYIRYRLRTDRDGDRLDDAVVAGPTCDGDDVLYRSYPLPITLVPGDRVEIPDTGAYTASYASVSFNGFSVLPTYFADDPDAGPRHEIVEPLAPGLTRNWRITEVICDAHTGFQHLVIGRTHQGIALFSDDERQSTEFSQLVYHEALSVPALLLAGAVDRVLVIGSGEGVISQLAVAAGATHVDHVDIDRDAVRLCAQHLPYGYTVDQLRTAESGFGPVTMHYCDGWEFVERSDARYDVVVIDLPDERLEPAQHNRLYDTAFLRRCRDIGRVVVAQAGCPTLWRNESLRLSWRRFHETFAAVSYFGSSEHEWSFLCGLADAGADPLAVMLSRLPTLPYRPRSIDADTLRAAYVPPKSLRED